MLGYYVNHWNHHHNYYPPGVSWGKIYIRKLKLAEARGLNLDTDKSCLAYTVVSFFFSLSTFKNFKVSHQHSYIQLLVRKKHKQKDDPAAPGLPPSWPSLDSEYSPCHHLVYRWHFPPRAWPAWPREAPVCGPWEPLTQGHSDEAASDGHASGIRQNLNPNPAMPLTSSTEQVM